MRYLIIPLLLAGCASPGYEQYIAAQQSIAVSRGDAERARYNALAAIAKTGDPAASVAAAMALAMGGQQQPVQIAAPQNEWLQWASVLVPALTQAYAIGQSANVAINASNNAARSAEATTAGFVGMAGKIQAPVIAPTVLPQANVSTITNTTLSGTGTLGSGSYSTDYHGISGSYNPASTVSTTAPAVATTVGP
jgi:hypothetical protein